MHPILWQHEGTPTITSWGALAVFACIVGWFLARRAARRLHVSPSHIDLLSPIMLGVGLAGAFALGYLAQLLHIDVSPGIGVHGGRVLLGGLLLAIAAAIAYAKIAHIPLGLLGDICAFPLAVGVSIGRLGCFMAGCCWGKTCPGGADCTFRLAVRFPPGSFAQAQHLQRHLIVAGAPSLPVYPIQLYESLAAALLALFLALHLPRRKVAGETFLAFGLGYSVLRFLAEFARADNPPILSLSPLPITLTLSQLICLAAALACLILQQLRRRHAQQWHLQIS